MTAMRDELHIRAVKPTDAAELADLLGEIIARGGTTALEDPLSAEELADAYLIGPDVHGCFVAIMAATGRIEGFQTLVRHPPLPNDIGDIATFARIDGTQRGVGSALFAATKDHARALGLTAISATIRADNHGGLAFYSKQGFADYAVAQAIPLKSGITVDRITKRYLL